MTHYFVYDDMDDPPSLLRRRQPDDYDEIFDHDVWRPTLLIWKFSVGLTPFVRPIAKDEALGRFAHALDVE